MPKAAVRESRRSKPKLGQHFLVSDSAAQRHYRISGRCFAEHGARNRPGPRRADSMLAARARRLIAIELDRVLAAQLRMKFGQTRERGNH